VIPATGSVHRELESVLDVATVPPVGVPVTGDDEERVVDADTESDEEGQLRRKVRRVQHVREQRDQTHAGTKTEEGHQDRQAHREERTETDEQDDARRRDSDRGGRAQCRALRLLYRAAAKFHLEPARAARSRN
jgi:hypothetical protein